MKRPALLLALALLFLTSGRLAAQQVPTADSTQYVLIETTDGNEFFGPVIAETSEIIVLRTEMLGEVSIRKQTIRVLRVLGAAELHEDEYWPALPRASHYLLGSSSFGQRKDEGYYQNTWVLLNQFSLGASDRFSIDLGILPLFVTFPVWASPKFSIPTRNPDLNFAAGAFLAYVPVAVDLEESFGFGTLYGQMTYGSRERNLTLGGGYGWWDGERSPVIKVGALVRTSRRFAFVAENYVFGFDQGANDAVVCFGGRFIGRRSTWDAALFTPILSDNSTSFLWPWLSVVTPIGKKK